MTVDAVLAVLIGPPAPLVLAPTADAGVVATPCVQGRLRPLAQFHPIAATPRTMAESGRKVIDDGDFSCGSTHIFTSKG